eukprot:scaffold962_cov372-Prasinococcus_capsulatus_cf.AAC.12
MGWPASVRRWTTIHTCSRLKPIAATSSTTCATGTRPERSTRGIETGGGDITPGGGGYAPGGI